MTAEKFVNKNSGIPEGTLRDFSLTNFYALHIRIINSKSGGKPLALRTNNQGANTMENPNYLNIKKQQLIRDIENWKSMQATYGDRADVQSLIEDARFELFLIEGRLAGIDLAIASEGLEP